MNKRRVGSRLHDAITAAALFIAVPGATCAANAATPSAPLVKVLPNQYEAGGKRFADLDQRAG